MREADLKTQVNDLLKSSGMLWFRMQSGRLRIGKRFIYLAEEGTPDYLIFKDTVPRWLELKGEGQRTQKDRAQKQAGFRERALALGHRHLCTDNLDAVIEFLKG